MTAYVAHHGPHPVGLRHGTFIHIGFLQAIKRPMYGFVEAVVRKIILPLGVFYIAVKVLEVGLDGFWFSMVGINVAMTVVTIAYARIVLRKLGGGVA